MYEQGELLSIDIDELGIRPSNWIDVIKNVDDSTIDYFRTEKTCELAVYSAELQLTNNEKKSTADDDNSSMSDEEYSNNYEIDPETGAFLQLIFNFYSKERTCLDLFGYLFPFELIH